MISYKELNWCHPISNLQLLQMVHHSWTSYQATTSPTILEPQAPIFMKSSAFNRYSRCHRLSLHHLDSITAAPAECSQASKSKHLANLEMTSRLPRKAHNSSHRTEIFLHQHQPKDKHSTNKLLQALHNLAIKEHHLSKCKLKCSLNKSAHTSIWYNSERLLKEAYNNFRTNINSKCSTKCHNTICNMLSKI